MNSMYLSEKLINITISKTQNPKTAHPCTTNADNENIVTAKYSTALAICQGEYSLFFTFGINPTKAKRKLDIVAIQLSTIGDTIK